MNIELQSEAESIIKAFCSLRTKEDLAKLLEIPVKVLNYYLYASENYSEFVIPKKNGSDRIIHAPISNIKILQTKLLDIFYFIFESHNSAYGFVPDRSIIDNASRHLNKRYVINIDLVDFFPSIHFGRVNGYFQAKYNIGNEASTALTKLLCIEQNDNSFLPQGAPTSPIISNMIAYRLDEMLSDYAKRNNAVYTRYADDITFSIDSDKMPKQIAFKDIYGDVWLNNRLTTIIVKNGFRVNFNKVRLRSNKQRQEVTGLIVNSGNPNIKREYIRNITAILHNWETKGYEHTQNTYVAKYRKNKDSDYKKIHKIEFYILGKLNFLSMVRGKNCEIYIELKSKFDKLNKTRN